jgi:hypothetical protein
MAVSGTLAGYNLCINSDFDYYYLDVDAFSITPAMGTTGFVQNAFKLTGTYPQSFFDYWAAKGVVSGATGWQGIMWNIINGTSPMFYMNYTGTDYQLIDGLQYQMGSGANTLRVSGDYPQGQYTFNGTVTDVNGCVTAPFDVKIDFNTIPHMNAVANQTYCNGASASETVLGATVTGTTFAWTNSNAAIGLAASGSGNIPSFTATNSTNEPITATITVTPTAPSACAGNAVALYTITVYPTPAVNTVSNAVYCNGSAGAAISFSSPTTGGTVTYNWTSTVDVGFGTSGTGDVLAYTATNAGSEAVVATVSVTATVNGCTGPATTFTVTVNPTPVASASVTTAISCNGSTGTVTIVATVGTAPFTYYFGSLTNNTGVFTGISAGTYSWSVTDASGCSSATGSLEVTQPAAIQLSGTVKYYKDYTLFGVYQPNKPMNNVTVTLFETGTENQVGDPVITDVNGQYTFNNVCPGIYDVVITTGKPIGGINSTDAGQVNAWNVARSTDTEGNDFWPSIEKVRFLAGDVTGEVYNVDDDVWEAEIGANDAQRIQQYYVTFGGISFEKPWEFWKAGEMVTINPQTENVMRVEIVAGSSNVTQDFFGLVSGDFNRSFNPTTLSSASASETLTLLQGEDVPVLPFTTIDVPITAVNAMEVGAISLILSYPDDKLQVEGVFLQDKPDQPVMFNAKDGVVRIGWNSMTPISMGIGEALLTVRLKATTHMVEGEVSHFELAIDPLNELANADFEVIQNATLSMDGLKLAKDATTGIEMPDRSSQMLLTAYPNPFREYAKIKYTLPEDGTVNIEVTGVLGNRVRMLTNQQQAAGEYLMNLDGDNIVPGVYQITLRFKNQYGRELMQTIRMVKQ